MELNINKDVGNIDHNCVVYDSDLKYTHYFCSIFTLQSTINFCKKYNKKIISLFYSTFNEAKKYFQENCE